MADPEQCGMVCAEYLADVIKDQTSENVAYFIAEPVLGEGGIIVPPIDYFRTVKQILDHYNILFILDEVQTGFCRTGKMFAAEHYSIEPDIMIMAKGIANGFPLSCFIADNEIADAFQPGDHLSTFGGNPVSCAASLANIEFMEETNLAEEAAGKGERVKEMLRTIAPKNVELGDIRGKGLMIGIEIVEKGKTKTPASAEAAKIRAAMREKGVLIGVGGAFANVLRFQPPLVIGDSELEQVVERLRQIMES
jgi:4-aminobutyrate aminotransferase-like enzyme